ncbi:hypothetical protein [Streptomyces coelicoflavus]|uniref:hypothetical protein n=1 Tax=Streptomyces coelicoflavus TaxID=285562 RepID=UPI00363D93AD
MKVRADVAELLRAGYSDRAIARHLNVDRIKTVARSRAALRIPNPAPGPKAAGSPEDLFWRRVQPTDDGHMKWTGHLNTTGSPAVRHGGRTLSAYRIAYRLATGREPEGYALPSCDRDGCVKPGHHSDRADREREKRVDALYAGIFGQPS